MTIKISSICTVLLVFLGVGAAIPAMAQESQKQSVESERVREAATILTEIMSIPENSIPEELMARAHGIAVIPHVEPLMNALKKVSPTHVHIKKEPKS
jgi:hypothetical protein